MQIAQVLLTLPTSFAQLGYPSGVALQLFYGLEGCWACYMISWLYMEYRTRMEREGHTFKTHVIQVGNLTHFQNQSCCSGSNPILNLNLEVDKTVNSCDNYRSGSKSWMDCSGRNGSTWVWLSIACISFSLPSPSSLLVEGKNALIEDCNFNFIP